MKQTKEQCSALELTIRTCLLPVKIQEDELTTLHSFIIRLAHLPTSFCGWQRSANCLSCSCRKKDTTTFSTCLPPAPTPEAQFKAWLPSSHYLLALTGVHQV